MTSTSVCIHEFSTGIQPQRTPDGGWVSVGFTGQYMNATIDSIPQTIQRSIANKEFAVVEGASTEEPAIVGRVISGQPNWSVVAVVSRGQDEKGRSASFYRYFLCEGEDGLGKILDWMEQCHDRMPTFNPYDIRVVGQPNQGHISPSSKKSRSEIESQLVGQSAPIILELNRRYDLQLINQMAEAKADDRPISWAFNAEALEQPWRFVIIHPASDRADRILHKAISNPPVRPSIAIDEQALKSAIKSLISSSQVKQETLQVIEEALENNEVTTKYWTALFDGQGASNGLRQGIYSSQMVRLLTLRAIILPETLPDYLIWLKVEENLNKRNYDRSITDFLSFQSKLKPYLNLFTRIQNNCFAGIQALPEAMSTNLKFKKSILWLLAIDEGIWKKSPKEISHNIRSDFQYLLIELFPKKEKEIEEIMPLQGVILLVLISSLVTGGLGFWLGGSRDGWSNSVGNPTTEAPFPDPGVEGENISLGEFEENSTSTSDERSIHNQSPSMNTAIEQPNSQNFEETAEPSRISPEKKEEARNNFDKTQQALKQLLDELEPKVNKQRLDASRLEGQLGRSRIIQEIQTILKVAEFDYDMVVNQPRPDEIDKLIEAIYSYQKSFMKNIDSPDGYIQLDKKTYQELKSDLIENLALID